ncbi:putative transcriptional regulator [Mesorhizobium sp. J18]|nr:putative transcriptional regulator [Mesorhizobium sp. J18]
MMSLKEIVVERLKQLGVGPIEAANAAEMERTFIRDIVEDRKKSVRADKISQLAYALALDESALARGELVPAGPEKSSPLVAGKTSRIISSFDPDESPSPEAGEVAYSRGHWKPSIKGALPEVDVRLGAGNGNVGEVITLPVGNDNISGHRVTAEWLLSEQFIRHEAKASVAHTVVMEVIGDSMQPNYLPGDRVLVDLSQNTMTTDTVYAISDGISEPQIKRLQRVMFSDPVQVRIISDNPALETDTVELEKLTIIGRVCGHIARK